MSEGPLDDDDVQAWVDSHYPEQWQAPKTWIEKRAQIVCAIRGYLSDRAAIRMSEGQHTPGPWIVFVGADDFAVLPAGRLGEVAGGIANTHDASLIAAGPDMFAALKTLLRKFENCSRSHGNDDEVIADATAFARAAIAKAQGKYT